MSKCPGCPRRFRDPFEMLKHYGKKHPTSHRSGRSSAGAPHSEGIGSAYLDGKVAAQVMAPVVDLATHLQGQTASGAAADLKAHVMSSAYAQGAISAIGQRWVDK